MKKLAIALFVSLSAVLCCPGCSGPTEPPPSSITPIDSAKVQAALANIKSDMELAGCQITVKAENDLLVITGKVGTDGAKQRAEALAKKVKGINKVANHLQVEPSSVNMSPQMAP